MAKDSEPRARPITVSELIARSETNAQAFPKSASEDDRRAARRAGASGMPSHTPSVPDEPSAAAADTASIVDDAEANRVTGIIPIVRDEPAEPDAIVPVPVDDLVGVDLPALEYQWETAEETTAAVPVVESDPADAERDDADIDDDPESGHRRIASSADLAAAKEAEDEADATERAADQADDAEADQAPSTKAALLGWLVLLGEVVAGLAVGAGLFWGFTELWKRYIYLALILAVVVIFAIVTFAHVLRKRDLATTLLALGVGMLVTIGPLVLLAA